MTIRPLVNEDASEWLRMRAALWPETGNHEAEIAAILAGDFGPFGVFVAARDDGKLQGFVEVGERSYAEGAEQLPCAHVEGWWVDPDCRGRGVGRALIEAAAGWARDCGYRDLTSDAHIDNEGSIAAHGALGFAEVDRIVCFRRPIT